MLDAVRDLFRRPDQVQAYTLSYLRDLLCDAWKPQSKEVSQKYRDAGNRSIAGIAYRVAQVFRDYQTVMPLQLNKMLVPRIEEGLANREVLVEYALMKRWRSDDTQYVVNIRRSRPPSFWKFPDYVGLTRWLHAKQRDIWGELPILHVPVLNGKVWIERGLEMPLVRRQVNTILDAMSVEHQFARPGAHCEQCTQPRCLEKIHGM